MPTTLIEIDEAFRALHRARGTTRVAAFKRYCQTVIAARQRGELGILPAASYVEGCLAYPELKENADAEQIVEKACCLLSPLHSLSRGQEATWRELVRHVAALPD